MNGSGHLLTRPSHGRPAAWAGLGAAIAIAIGVTSVASTKAALAIAVVVAVAVATTARSSAILALLIATLFIEVVSLGSLTISRIVAPVALLVIAIEWLRGTARPRIDAQLAWVAAYAIWALASLLWTQDLAGTLNLLASLAIAITYMLAFAILLRDVRDLRMCLWVLAGASVVVGLLSLVGVGGLGGTASDIGAERAQGGVGDPNFFAALQIVAFPLMLGLASSVRGWARVGLYAGAVISIASALDTLSRGGLIAMACVLLVLPLLRARSLLGSGRQKAAVLLCVVLGVVVVFSVPSLSHKIVTRAKTIFVSTSSAEASGGGAGASGGSGRVDIWRAAVHAVEDHPVQGVGFGAFRSQATRYMLTTPGVDPNVFVPRPIEVHSAYLGAAAETGLVGVAIYLGLLLSTALALRRTAAAAFRAGTPFVGRIANAALLALLGWAVASCFLESETSRGVWVLVGLSLGLPKLVPAAAATPRRPRFASASLPPRDRRTPGLPRGSR
jgi:O-antigen ligase